MRKIDISDVEGKQVLCFDTALDARSFARTKLAQCITDPGYIIYPDGSNRTWKASGVAEVNNSMKIYGPVFAGDRLDALIEAAKDDTSEDAALKNTALQALVIWIRAKIALGNTPSSFAPGATIIANSENSANEHPKGSIFFSPETISDRCLIAEGITVNHFTSQDLSGMDAVAFCAGTMLYEIFGGACAYNLSENIHQEMRDGSFLPLDFAAPNLNKNITSLVETALLLPVPKKRTSQGGGEILNRILKALTGTNGETQHISSFYLTLPEEEKLRIAKEKNRFIKRKNAAVKTKHFLVKNRSVLIGAAVAAAFFIPILGSILSNTSNRISTKGMTPPDVINLYYDSLDELNHVNMEVCISGADKADINMVTTFFATEKIRQATEMDFNKSIISAKSWKNSGGSLPAPNVFGVTDLSISLASENERDKKIRYNVNYTLWIPSEKEPINRKDQLTLTRKKGNWQITEINRSMR